MKINEILLKSFIHITIFIFNILQRQTVIIAVAIAKDNPFKSGYQDQVPARQRQKISCNDQVAINL